MATEFIDKTAASLSLVSLILRMFAVAVMVWGTSLKAASTEQVVLALNTVNTFECQKTAHALLWHFNINGSRDNHPDIDEAPAESLGNGIIKQNLIVRATLALNNSVIMCIARQTTGLVTVFEMDVAIQGYLKAPGGLKVQPVNDSAVMLHWETPFTLDITDVELDIMHYTILVTNTDTGNVTLVNVSGTAVEYVYVGEQCKDTTYTFTIAAWNVVGEGDMGTFPGRSTLKGYWVLEVMPVIISHSEQIVSATFSFDISSQRCPLPETCIFEVTPSRGSTETFHITVDNEQQYQGAQLHENLQLQMNEKYDFKIICDGLHITDTFRTHGTQSANVTPSVGAAAGTFDVKCTFAQGSAVQGCAVVFTGKCEQELIRNNGETIAAGQIVLPQGMYQPEVYDIDPGGGRHNTIAVSVNEFTVQFSTASECKVGEEGEPETGGNSKTWTVADIVASVVIPCACVVSVLIIICVVWQRKKKKLISSAAQSQDSDVGQKSKPIPQLP